MVRPLFIGLGAAGALTAAVTGVVITRAPTIPAERLRTGETVCIKSNVRLVEGMTQSCYTSAQYEALRDRAVIGGDGAPAELSLSDDAGGGAAVRTCAEFDAMTADGNYAQTGADMRREEYFRRACGALAMLVKARPAQSSHFAGGAADIGDVRSMAASADFGFGETAPPEEIAKAGEGVWRLSSPSAEMTLFEIAHADFTGDGLGEILAYVSLGAEGGTARAGAIGLMEKPSAGGPCAFRAR